jgi:hypothetical protein
VTASPDLGSWPQILQSNIAGAPVSDTTSVIDVPYSLSPRGFFRVEEQ